MLIACRHERFLKVCKNINLVKDTPFMRRTKYEFCTKPIHVLYETLHFVYKINFPSPR